MWCVLCRRRLKNDPMSVPPGGQISGAVDMRWRRTRGGIPASRRSVLALVSGPPWEGPGTYEPAWAVKAHDRDEEPAGHVAAKQRRAVRRALVRLMATRPPAHRPGRGSWGDGDPDARSRNAGYRDGVRNERQRAYVPRASGDGRPGPRGKASFVLWLGAMTVHVLAYLWRLPRLARGEPASRAGRRASQVLARRAARWLLLTASVMTGLPLAMLTVHRAGAWSGSLGPGH